MLAVHEHAGDARDGRADSFVTGFSRGTLTVHVTGAGPLEYTAVRNADKALHAIGVGLAGGACPEAVAGDTEPVGPMLTRGRMVWVKLGPRFRPVVTSRTGWFTPLPKTVTLYMSDR